MTDDINIGSGMLIVNGNLTQSHSSISVGIGELYVKGDFLQSEASGFNAGSGNTVVDGNLHIYAGSNSSRYVKIENNDGYVFVKGNYSFYSPNSSSIKLTAGVLEVKGNYTNTSTVCSQPRGTHRVILSGDGEQIISGTCYFNVLNT